MHFIVITKAYEVEQILGDTLYLPPQLLVRLTLDLTHTKHFKTCLEQSKCDISASYYSFLLTKY